jgi:hypothetical protein
MIIGESAGQYGNLYVCMTHVNYMYGISVYAYVAYKSVPYLICIMVLLDGYKAEDCCMFHSDHLTYVTW